MAEEDEIKIDRITKLKVPKAKDLVKSNYAAKGYNLKVLKHVEEVLARLYDDLQQYPEFQANPDYGTIVSAHRTAARQKELMEEAKEKYKDDPERLKNLDELVADATKNKVTPHMTGAAMDFYLGKPIESEHINSIRKSKLYDLFSRHAYHNYKLAPYSVEPWHWECGDACKANIDQILLEEKAVAQAQPQINTNRRTVSYRQRNTLPPPLPADLNNRQSGIDDDYGMTQKEIMEFESSNTKKKNTLKFLIGGSILLTTFLITTRKK
jgi:uncharacterized protein YcbK (DUF882 family)